MNRTTILEFIIETQVDIIKTNDISSEFYNFLNNELIDNYLELLDYKLEVYLASKDFLFEIKYQEKFNILIFIIEFNEEKILYSYRLSEIEKYINDRYGKIEN